MPDPYYQQILDGLAGPLDPDVFEEAAGDLLRDAFPALVPIRGGTDFGMDGAISDGKGPAYPLTCTTSPDVIGNLRSSLESYVLGGGTRRKVVVATSQHLSGTKRRNLNKEAERLGFQLVQIADQAAFAHRLYRNNDWCRRLLGLTGRPSALSVIPETDRPLIGDALVGRDADLDWLRNLDGDGMLVGQPGSGKTSLFRQLAVEGWGLFVVDSQPDALANAIRAQQPAVVVVDDAHVRSEVITKLRQLRSELGASYRIVASSWPGDADSVAVGMNLASAQRRNLELLTRDQIVEVVKSVGIRRPNRLIRSIVDQADGRPGLAVTLANFCIRGDVTDVFFGEVLKRSLAADFESLVGRRATQILAALSLGGKVGMTVSDVASGLGLSAVDVQSDIVRLAAAGVLMEVDQRLSVRPDILRYLLVRDVFFSGAVSLPMDSFLDKTPSLEETAITLIGVRGYGGDVPDRLIMDMLERADSQSAWSLFASLGAVETTTALRRHPELAISVARHALSNAPDIVLPLLLQKAVGDDRALNSHMEHPLRLIEGWIKARPDVAGDAAARRKSLLQAIKQWLGEGGNRDVARRALGFVLTPGYEHDESDPGSGNTVTFSRSLLPPEQITQIGALWPEVRDSFGLDGSSDFEHVLQIAHTWTYPETLVLTGKLPEGCRSAISPIAQTIIKDLAAIAANRPGVIHRLQEYADELEITLPADVSSEFETLFPKSFLKNWRDDDGKYADGIERLAESWRNEDPHTVCGKIVQFDREARQAGINWPRGTVNVCLKLAAKVPQPLVWFRALREAAGDGELLEPFLAQAIQRREAGWENAIRECMGDPDRRWLGVAQGLMQDVSIDLVNEALSHEETCERIVETMCHRGQIPRSNVFRLLGHISTKVATATAIGEWHANSQGTVPPDLYPDWKSAVLRSDADDTWIPEILKHEPALAEEWLIQHLASAKDILRSDVCRSITERLDQAARRRLMSTMPATYRTQRIAKALVGNDLELYRELLNNVRLKHFHLDPLHGMKAPKWRDMALAALDAGYSPELVADAVHGGSTSWSGPESGYWQEWVDRFLLLEKSDDDRMKQVADFGVRNAQRRRDVALVHERHEAIYGDG